MEKEKVTLSLNVGLASTGNVLQICRSCMLRFEVATSALLSFESNLHWKHVIGMK